MLLSTMLAKGDADYCLLEGGHGIGAGRVSGGHVVTKKTQSASGCECLRHRFQTSPFLPVQN